MRYHRLGRTGLNVSEIGFGASPLGNVFGDVDAAECTRAVHCAVDNGINVFDVAPYYGATLAERRLGAALEGRRGKVVLATKCGRYGPDDFDFSAARVRSSLEESLRRLRTDTIDLFQVHDIEYGDSRQIVGETLPEIRKLQEEGKVRFLGITGLQLRTLQWVASEFPVDTILSYCRYNLLITDMDWALTPFAAKSRIGLLNAAPMHMGVLTDQGPPDWHPAPPQVKEAARRAAEYCRARGECLSGVALRFCLDHRSVASTVVGMATQAQVEANLRAGVKPRDPELLAHVKGILRPESGRFWHTGRKENSDAAAAQMV
jgi:L-galactose dehydrogenase